MLESNAWVTSATDIRPDEQVRVEKIQSDLVTKMRPAGLAEQSVVRVLADGLSTSSLDRAKVDAAIAQLEAASAVVHDAAIDELNQLHAVLTAPERAALVEKLEAHWELWKEANAGRRGHVSVIAKEIGLTQDQLEKVRKDFESVTVASPLREREVGGHMRDFGAAFRADTFDAKALLGAGDANRHMAGWGATRLARFCEAVNPVLTNEQRGKLVELLREHLSHDEGRTKE